MAATATVFAMLGLAAVSAPLYRAFCSLTGYEGTPRIAGKMTAAKGTRVMHVRFDANVGNDLPWTFEPETAEIDLKTGKTATVFYKVTNRSTDTITARAVYNVGPPSMGAYFNKLACFCFSDQTLKPKETLEMPVVFFLDPALEKDQTMDGVSEVILSYTFYRRNGASVASQSQSTERPPL